MKLLALDHIESEGPTLDMKKDCRILSDHIQRISQEMSAVDGSIAVQVPKGSKKSGSPSWTVLIGQLRKLLETNHKNTTERCLEHAKKTQEKQFLAVGNTGSDEMPTHVSNHQHKNKEPFMPECLETTSLRQETHLHVANEKGSNNEGMELANQNCVEMTVSIPDEAACETVDQQVDALQAGGTVGQECEAAPTRTDCASDCEPKETDCLIVVDAAETIEQVADNHEFRERGTEELEPRGAMEDKLEVLDNRPDDPDESLNDECRADVEDETLCALRPAACVVNNQAACTSRRVACSGRAQVPGQDLKSCKSAATGSKRMATPSNAKLCQQKPAAKHSKKAAKNRGAGTLKKQCAIAQQPSVSTSRTPDMSRKALPWKCIAAAVACIAASVIACSLNYLI